MLEVFLAAARPSPIVGVYFMHDTAPRGSGDAARACFMFSLETLAEGGWSSK